MLNPLVRAPRATDLAAPVGTFMRPTLTVESGDSLARGAQTLRENGGIVLPIVDEKGLLRAVLSDAGLARALAEASEPTDAVGPFGRRADTIAPYATAAEALRRGEDGRTLVVVDDAARPVGLIAAVDLWPRRRTPPRPAVVGGMATPFGVYLTSGSVSAGAPWWALMATGAAMASMLLAGALAVRAVPGLPDVPAMFLSFAVFVLLMRLSPLSGTHGAEHQVVNAIEREETLVSEVVRRMPLVHPRCGTNLMVGVTIFLTFLAIPILPEDVRVVLGLVFGLAFAMPLGTLAQRFVTTKRPSDRQLAGAIRAGEGLLLAHATARHSRATPFRRVWSMGLLQVMAGAFAVFALLALVKALTHAAWIPDMMS